MAAEGPTHLWLRCETKPFEHRAALTPTTAKALMDAGFKVTVERDPQRIFKDEEYEALGCPLVETDSWKQAPPSALITGLKELHPHDTSPLSHSHIMFAHCYKSQAGWQDVLSRWSRGATLNAGTDPVLYDLEFLQDPVSGRRIAAFGYHAGFAGACVGLLALNAQSSHPGAKLGSLKPYPNEGELVERVKREKAELEARLGRGVTALVIGALGRCGRGAVEALQKAGLKDEDIFKWDLPETARGGPFPEILQADLFINCIYLSSPIPPFLTADTVIQSGKKRRLGVLVDVSCDTTNPHNPVPVYEVNTTFEEPTLQLQLPAGLPPLSVVSIDHLPTLLPREASEAFSNDLLPWLKELPDRKKGSKVWGEAERLFREMVRKMEAAGEDKEERKGGGVGEV